MDLKALTETISNLKLSEVQELKQMLYDGYSISMEMYVIIKHDNK